MKRELPSKQQREISMNIEAENKSKYRRLVTLGYKMTDEVINTLCPCPSKQQLFNNVLCMVNKHMENSVEINSSVAFCNNTVSYSLLVKLELLPKRTSKVF